MLILKTLLKLLSMHQVFLMNLKFSIIFNLTFILCNLPCKWKMHFHNKYFLLIRFLENICLQFFKGFGCFHTKRKMKSFWLKRNECSISFQRFLCSFRFICFTVGAFQSSLNMISYPSYTILCLLRTPKILLYLFPYSSIMERICIKKIEPKA